MKAEQIALKKHKRHWEKCKREKEVSKKKNYIKTVCMFSISEFQYAFQAHPALLQLLRKYPQIFTLYMYTVLNKQMFNKWNRSVKKSTKNSEHHGKTTPYEMMFWRKEVICELLKTLMWSDFYLNIQCDIFAFSLFSLDGFDFCQSQPSASGACRKKVDVNLSLSCSEFLFFVVAYAFWRYAITLFFFFRSELYFFHLKFKLSNKIR